jgi:hypothetical protein
MEFRWIAIIALWTLLSGPIFHATRDQPRASHPSPVKVSQR